MSRGRVRARLGRAEEALADFKRVIELSPNSARGYAARAEFYLLRSAPTEAFADATRAIEITNQVADHYALRAGALEQLAQKADPKQRYSLRCEALRDYASATTLEPQNATLWKRSGDVWREVMQSERSIEYYQLAAEKEPGNAQHLYDIAAANETVGLFHPAVLNLELAIALDPKFARAYALEVVVMFRWGVYDRALTLAATATELNPKDLSTRELCIRIHQIRRDYEGVVDECTEALRIEPKQPRFFVQRAEALSQLARFDEALLDTKSAK